MAADVAFLEGQRWRFRTAAAAGVLVIGRIDRKWLRRAIVHVSIEAPVVIGHLAFTEAALRSSVEELLPATSGVGPTFAKGLALWHRDRGTAFEISVAAAVEAVAGVARGIDAFAFDAFVTAMRARRSEAMIAELHDRLFALSEWFFLAWPDRPRIPVTWTFPDGANPAPCILAFTDRGKAQRCATEKGLVTQSGEAIVIAGPVRQAVPWLLSGPASDGVTWICFNHGSSSVSFPLYLDEVRARLGPAAPG